MSGQPARSLPVMRPPSVLTIAADLARLSYAEGIPDVVADEMRRKALLLRNEYDKGRRTERLGRSLHRVVKVCPDCGTACPSCARPSDTDERNGRP